MHWKQGRSLNELNLVGSVHPCVDGSNEIITRYWTGPSVVDNPDQAPFPLFPKKLTLP